jgi:hypothetical protein
VVAAVVVAQAAACLPFLHPVAVVVAAVQSVVVAAHPVGVVALVVHPVAVVVPVYLHNPRTYCPNY